MRTRSERLRALGIEARPDTELDAFARELAQRTGGCYAGVNFFLDADRQFFAGLYSAAQDTPVHVGSSLLEDPVPGRVMPRDIDMGICPHVVKRRRALVLEDIRDFPRFAGNRVVDAIGIHSYLGAPLIDSTGVVLGTICVVDQDPQPWGVRGWKPSRPWLRNWWNGSRSRRAAAADRRCPPAKSCDPCQGAPSVRWTRYASGHCVRLSSRIALARCWGICPRGSTPSKDSEVRRGSGARLQL